MECTCACICYWMLNVLVLPLDWSHANMTCHWMHVCVHTHVICPQSLTLSDKVFVCGGFLQWRGNISQRSRRAWWRFYQHLRTSTSCSRRGPSALTLVPSPWRTNRLKKGGWKQPHYDVNKVTKRVRDDMLLIRKEVVGYSRSLSGTRIFEVLEGSDAARHNRTCGKSTARPHVRARAVNVR